MGAVAAAESPDGTNNVTMNSIDDTTPVVSGDAGGAETLLGMSNEENNVLGEEPQYTFRDLNNKINGNNDSVVYISGNYKFIDGDDIDYQKKQKYRQAKDNVKRHGVGNRCQPVGTIPAFRHFLLYGFVF